MRLTEEAKGVFIISVTPFEEDGALDLTSAARLIDFYIDCGVAGITILGMMGEAAKLTPEEAADFAAFALKRVEGRVPVVVGVSAAGLDNLARLSAQVMDVGAAGVMVAPTPGLATDEKIRGYYAAICQVIGPEVPLVYQDFPQATGVQLSVPTFNRLVDDHPQIVMLKHEDCPGLGKITEIRESAEREGRRRVSILVGNGGLYLPQELARGADGAMTGFAYPEMLVEVCRLYTAGEAERAEDLFDIYLPLVRHEQQPGFGLAVRKEVLRRRGMIASARTRKPGPSLTTRDQAELDHLMARLERRLGDGK